MTRRRPGGGFTLLEVVLALSLVMGLMGAVYAFYHRVGQVRQAVVRQARFAAAVRGAMDLMTAEIRCMMTYRVPVPPPQGLETQAALPQSVVRVGLEGKPAELRFITAVLPGPASWAIRSVVDEPIPPEQDAQYVGYRLRMGEDGSGQPYVVGLERTCQKVVGVILGEQNADGSAPQVVGIDVRGETPAVSADLLATEIRFLALRYHTGQIGQVGLSEAAMEEESPDAQQAPAELVDNWNPRGQLPLAVEIILGAEPCPQDMDLAEYLATYPTFRRLVHVPAGVRRSQQGGSVRPGPGGGL